jgi:hypoxanthine phosphoribosyltransferase
MTWVKPLVISILIIVVLLKNIPMETINVHGLDFQPFLSPETIQERVKTLGAEIRAAYAGKRPLFLGLLNGAFVFAADLVRAADIECEVSFVKLSSYAGLSSSGTVNTLIGMDIDLTNRHVILVEDIVDTGRTLTEFKVQLQAQATASVAIATLLLKPDALQMPLSPEYVGFSIPNKFVIGYGLDYNQLGRALPGIWQLAE